MRGLGRAMELVTRSPSPRGFPGMWPSQTSPTQNSGIVLWLPQGGFSCRKQGFSHIAKQGLEAAASLGCPPQAPPKPSSWLRLWVWGLARPVKDKPPGVALSRA